MKENSSFTLFSVLLSFSGMVKLLALGIGHKNTYVFRCLIVEPNDELTSIPYRLTVDVISNELNTNTLLRRMDAIFSLHEESSEALVDFNTEFSSEPPLTYLEKVMFIQHEICISEVKIIAF